MRKKIPRRDKQIVIERADCKCEYCKMHQDFLFLPFEIDHIVSIKHGGGNELENLAFACQHCNKNKGSDLTTFLDTYQNIIPLFNPRLQVWDEHFKAVKGVLVAKTIIGEATIKLLKINNPEKVEVRQYFQKLGLYP